MQIDFHLGVTYILSRMAGFSPAEANIIAGASQFVDDAVHDGLIQFDNDFLYEVKGSAHKNLDYRNFEELKNHLVWIPFHFLPSASQDFPLICRKNSIVAQQMLNHYLPFYKEKMGLYLLGVCLHTYADTWAHQGFSGLTSMQNTVTDIFDQNGIRDEAKLQHRKKFYQKSFFQIIKDWFVSQGVSAINPIGHGAVLSYPDQPYLIWAYEDWRGIKVSRNNPQDYFEAAQEILKYLVQVRQNLKLPVQEIKIEDLNLIEKMISTICDENGLSRLQVWKDQIQEGKFSYGSDVWSYENDQASCWTKEYFELETDEDFEFEDIEYDPQFLTSNWKLAHDALHFHRFSVLHQILPQHNLCLA